MSDIYMKQLTTRGLHQGSSTARGSNHFLSFDNYSSRSGVSSFNKKIPPALKSSMNSSRSMNRSGRITTLYEEKRMKQKSLKKQRELTQLQAVKRIKNETLGKYSSRSSRIPTSHLTKDHFRKQDLKLNKQLVASLKRKSHGTGSRLIAPDLPTRMESVKKISQIEKLKCNLLKKLSETNSTLENHKSQLEKKLQKLEDKVNEKKSLSNFVTMGGKGGRSKSAATLQDLKQMESMTLNQLSKEFQGTEVVNDEQLQACNDKKGATSGNMAFDNTGKRQIHEQTKKKKKVAVKRGIQHFPPYLGESYEDGMKSSYAAYNDQEFGEQPEYDKKNPVRLIAGSLYNENEVPYTMQDDPDNTIYFPFKGFDRMEKKVKRSRSTAKCLLMPKGGYATMIIDKRNRKKGMRQYRPTRWLKDVENQLDLDSEGEENESNMTEEEKKEKRLLKKFVRGQTRGGGRVKDRAMTKNEWKPKTGERCIARFPGNKEWYMAKIEKIHSRHLELRFKSRGNNDRAVVKKDFIRPFIYNRPLTAGFEGL
eukprot:g4559.t1